MAEETTKQTIITQALKHRIERENFFKSEDLAEDLACVGSEVVANYNDALINDQIIHLDYPTPLPYHEYWVYRRKEPPR